MSQQGTAPARPLYDHIEGIRLHRGWTKVRVAREAGIDRGTLENWKKQPRSPTAETVKAVAEALNIDPALALQLAGYPQYELLNESEKAARIADLEREIADRERLIAELQQASEAKASGEENSGLDTRRGII